MDVLYIVIPAYNEAENIEACVQNWYPVVERYNGGGASRLLIINDGSKDNTWEMLTALSADRPLLCPLTKSNGGHGSAVLFGYRRAIESGADLVFQTDADGQTLPEEFEAFWEKRNEYDATIGIRPNREDGKDRVFVEKVVCILLRLIFNVQVKDANAPFRLMRTSLLARYIDLLPPDYNIPNIFFTACFLKMRERVCFLPISFRPRQGGTNTINIQKIIKVGWKAIWDLLHLRNRMKEH